MTTTNDIIKALRAESPYLFIGVGFDEICLTLGFDPEDLGDEYDQAKAAVDAYFSGVESRLDACIEQIRSAA